MSQFSNEIVKTFRATVSIPAYSIVGPAATTAANEVSARNTDTAYIVGIALNVASTGTALKVAVGGSAWGLCGLSVSSGAIVTPNTAGSLIEIASFDASSEAYTIDTTTTLIPRTVGLSMQPGSTNATIEIQLNINNLRKT